MSNTIPFCRPTLAVAFLCAIFILFTQQTVRAQATPDLPLAAGYTTTDALPGMQFSLPVCITEPPGEKDRLFIVEKSGKIQVITGYGSPQAKKQVFLDVPAMLAAKNEGSLSLHNEEGVLGLAFHPDYAKNGLFFVTYDLTFNGKKYDRLARFKVSASDPNAADPQSELTLITQLDLADNHNGGCIQFGADGYLYYSMGDEGGGNDSFNNARFIDKDFFAAIYRLDVDQKPGSLPPNPHHQNSTDFPSAVSANSYAIPPDNPFINTKEHSGRQLDPHKIRTEIWATGLRNPWRFSFDPQTGRLFIGDVGQDRWEEIDIGTAGGDYGWSYFEGKHDGPRISQKPADVQCIDPIYDYGHGPGEFQGNCIIGGVISRGSNLPELNGAYIFGDNGAKHIWALRFKDGKWTPVTLIGRDNDMSAFGVDPRNGDVLICAYGAGKIERLVHAAGQ